MTLYTTWFRSENIGEKSEANKNEMCVRGLFNLPTVLVKFRKYKRGYQLGSWAFI